MNISPLLYLVWNKHKRNLKKQINKVHQSTSPYHYQLNWRIEGFNRTFLEILKLRTGSRSNKTHLKLEYTII